MLKRLITPKLSSQIIDFVLKKPKWSMTKVAKTIDAPVDYISRVRSEKQSLEFADVEALAKAMRLTPHDLVLAAMDRDDLTPKMRSLYDATRGLVEKTESFRSSLRRKPAKRPARPRRKVA